MFLSDGTAFKLEFLGNHRGNGFVKKTYCSDAECSPTRHSTDERGLPINGSKVNRPATLYDNRVVAEFAKELSHENFEDICKTFAAQRYSTVQYNCHHWCMAVWNDVVPLALRQHTYPDQWKCEAADKLGLAELFQAIPGGITGAEGGVLPTLLTRFRRVSPSVRV